MLPTIKIFVSSPGDVDTERKIADRVIERLRGEFGSRADLQKYLWEDEPMRLQTTFQPQIAATADFDAVVCILWSRMGTPLKGPDGRDYPSGTAYEVESARAAYESTGKPDLLLYLNQTPAQVRQFPRDEAEKMMRQIIAVGEFVALYCRGRRGEVIGGHVDYYNLGEFEDLLEKHLRSFILKKLPPREDADPAPKAEAEAAWRGRPYRGLEPFDFDQAPIFFGRTKAVGEVLALLRRRALCLDEARAKAVSGVSAGVDNAAAVFVLVCAMSGVGKSSLVRAGVLPLLTEPGGEIGLWRRMVLKPSEAPADGDLFDALAWALTRPNALPELLDGGVSLPELAFMLRQNPAGGEMLVKQGLGRASANARDAEDQRLTEEIRRRREAGRLHDVERLEAQRAALTPPTARLAVVIDQMEELFTLESVKDDDLRRRFVQALAALARSGGAWVVGTLRSDFFWRCAKLPELMELKAQGLYDLQSPTPEEIGQMIRRPAQAAGLAFERHPVTDVALDEALRDAAMRHPEALPLLEFALDRLYERRDERHGLMTWAAYRAINGLEGALATAAEAALAKLGPWQPSTFDHVMSGLVTTGAGADGAGVHRRTADYEALTSAPGAKTFVDGFIADRLFVADKGTDGRGIVSVAHEALLGRKPLAATADASNGPGQPPWLWERLGEWVEANADFLRLRARVTAKLRMWQEEAERDENLLQDQSLAEAHGLLDEHRAHLENHEIAFIELSAAKADAKARRRFRRLRQTAAVFAVLAAAASAAALLAWLARARRAAARNRSSACWRSPIFPVRRSFSIPAKRRAASCSWRGRRKPTRPMPARRWSGSGWR